MPLPRGAAPPHSRLRISQEGPRQSCFHRGSPRPKVEFAGNDREQNGSHIEGNLCGGTPHNSFADRLTAGPDLMAQIPKVIERIQRQRNKMIRGRG